jgi:hypothetical protein
MKSKFRNFLIVATSVLSWAVPSALPTPLKAQQPRSQNYGRQHVLKDGTIIQLRLKEGVSSELAQVGDEVACRVTEDVKVDDVLVIRKGSIARGIVTEARRKGMWHGGRITITVKAVRLADGEEVPLRLARISVAGSSSAPFLGLANQADVKPGEDMIGVVNDDFPIDAAKFDGKSSGHMGSPPRAQGSAGEPKTASADAPEEAATVVFRSTPDAAEIILDGKFMGNTPSTLRVSPGEHKISLQKSGFVTWQRTMTVNWGSSQTLDATLQEEAP